VALAKEKMMMMVMMMKSVVAMKMKMGPLLMVRPEMVITSMTVLVKQTVCPSHV
jgi:hypothetical protein